MIANVTNRIIVKGKEYEVARLKDLVLIGRKDAVYGIKEYFDFDTVIPMPKDLLDTEYNANAKAGLAILGYDMGPESLDVLDPYKTSPKSTLRKYMEEVGLDTVAAMKAYLRQAYPGCMKNARKILRNLKEHRVKDQYAWASKNWGSRINAYGYEETCRETGYWEFTFVTALTVPEPVFCKLSEMFPTLRFEVNAFDIGTNFASVLVFSGGRNTVKLEYDEGDEWNMRSVYAAVFGRTYEEEYYGPMEDDPVEEESSRTVVFFSPFARAGNIILPGGC